jgi:hypothetical protein
VPWDPFLFLGATALVETVVLQILPSAPHTRQRVMQAVLDIGKEPIIAEGEPSTRNL